MIGADFLHLLVIFSEDYPEQKLQSAMSFPCEMSMPEPIDSYWATGPRDAAFTLLYAHIYEYIYRSPESSDRLYKYIFDLSVLNEYIVSAIGLHDFSNTTGDSSSGSYTPTGGLWRIISTFARVILEALPAFSDEEKSLDEVLIKYVAENIPVSKNDDINI